MEYNTDDHGSAGLSKKEEISMKCPRCATENGERSVCTKCGMFLYNSQSRNRTSLSKKDMGKMNAKMFWQFSKRMLKFTAILAILLVLSFFIIIAIVYFAG